MEPITACMAAFSAVKAGVAAGKEIHSLFSDVGKLWDSIEAVKKHHVTNRDKPLNKLKGVNEQALETFIALQKARDMEKELREIIVSTRGLDAWSELLKIRAEVARERREEEKRRRIEREETKEAFLIAAVVIAAVVLFGGVLWAMIKYAPN